RICRTDDATQGRQTRNALPHAHGVVADVTRQDELVFRLVFGRSVLAAHLVTIDHTAIHGDAEKSVVFITRLAALTENFAELELPPCIWPTMEGRMAGVKEPS